MLAQGPTFSFEFFPPKTDEMVKKLEETLAELEPLKPSFCSVTYGAGGSTRERTLEVVLHIRHDTSMLAMPHLTCVGQSEAEIRALVQRYRDEGLENILALAGDPPLEGPVTGDFTYAVELIDVVREIGGFSVGVAAFPEVHPRSTDRETDRKHLAEKLRLSDFGITQFFFSADHFFRMRDELDALGVETPVIPSLFPIANVATARRFSATNGTAFPDWLAERLDPVEDDAEEVRRIGVDVAIALGQELLEQDVPGLHIYTLNRAESALDVWAGLGLSDRR